MLLLSNVFDGARAPYAVLRSTSVPNAQGEIPWMNISMQQGWEGEKVRRCERYYASRQQISILIAPQLY